jgi:ABC-type Fe3+ transport system substrate-binding protein
MQRFPWPSGLILLALLGAACGTSTAAPSPAAAPAKPAASSAPPAAGTAAPAASAPASGPGTAAPAGSADAPVGAASGGSAAAPAASPGLQANAAEWERLKEAARREGKVVISGPGFPGLRNGITDGFQRAYGITVEYLGLPPGEVITRVDREARAGTATIDVNLGGTSSCWAMGDRGQIDDVTGLLVDPSLYERAAWKDGQMRPTLASPSMPKDFLCGIQGSEWIMTDLFVNRDVVPPSAISSWKDLLRPEYRGKIASFDPRRAGSAQTTVAYLDTLFGEQYLKDLYVGQAVTLTADYRQLAEWVARGTYPIGIGLVQANVEPLRAEGLPLERVFPADGQGALTGGFGTAHKIKGGPDPNAAALFLNWFVSRDAQEMWEREMMETSLRTDVPHQVPDYVIPKANVAYPINDYHPDYFFSKRAPAIARIQEILGR